MVYRHALQCWQAKAARGAVKWQSLAKALCFNKQQLLGRAVRGWAEAVQVQQAAAAAASQALQGVARNLELQGAADALWGWLGAAQVQAQHAQLLLAAAAARQQRTQQQVRKERQGGGPDTQFACQPCPLPLLCTVGCFGLDRLVLLLLPASAAASC